LMERVRTEAAKIALERNDAAVGNGKPLATALARMRTMTPPPAFPSINAVDVKRERLDQLLQNARKKTAVARWIPKIFRGLFRRQGDYNKLLLETTSILVRATAQLSSRLSEVTAGLELQNEWMRELPAQQVDPRHLQDLQAQADRLGLTVQTRQADLERADVDLGDAGYDLIVVTRYLHRALMPHLLLSLAPGGVLLYETFLIGQAERGHPTNPAFLLEPGELPALVQPLRILRRFEGDIDGALMSAVVARRQ